MGPGRGARGVEQPDPVRPRSSGLRRDGGVAHAGERAVVGLRFFFPDEMKPGGGVGLAGLRHASPDEALEVFLNGHDRVSFARTQAKRPSRDRSRTRRFVSPIRGYAPLCLVAGLRWGKAIEVGRGSAPPQTVSPDIPDREAVGKRVV